MKIYNLKGGPIIGGLTMAGDDMRVLSDCKGATMEEGKCMASSLTGTRENCGVKESSE